MILTLAKHERARWCARPAERRYGSGQSSTSVDSRGVDVKTMIEHGQKWNSVESHGISCVSMSFLGVDVKTTIRSLLTTCEAPRCKRPAKLEVNLSCLAEYMAKWVCDRHVTWAENDLKQYVPTD